MINKNIKFLIPFLLLLTSNANFQGMEEETKSIPKSFSVNNFNYYFKPESILKQKGEKRFNLNRVTFNNIVKILLGDEIMDKNLKELEKSRRKTFKKERYPKLISVNDISP